MLLEQICPQVFPAKQTQAVLDGLCGFGGKQEDKAGRACTPLLREGFRKEWLSNSLSSSSIVLLAKPGHLIPSGVFLLEWRDTIVLSLVELPPANGKVAEWFKAALLKSVGCNSPEGSNPSLSSRVVSSVGSSSRLLTERSLVRTHHNPQDYVDVHERKTRLPWQVQQSWTTELV